MTMLATIHMPSSEVFLNFDRVIVLADGFTIYNGPPRKVVDYFKEKQIIFPVYSNPADFLLKIANCPHLVKQDLNIK
jgi:ABC-type multidrug transport system ATPase subunit